MGAAVAVVPQRTSRFRYPGRLRRDDWAALAGILFVLPIGIGWRTCLPRRSGCPGRPGGGRTGGTSRGVWQRLHELLAELRARGALEELSRFQRGCDRSSGHIAGR